MNQTPLNPDGVLNAMDTLMAETDADERATEWAHKVTTRVLEGYFAVAQPVVNSVEELAKAWYVGFCKGEQTAFRERPVNPDTINPYKNRETP